MGARHPPPKTSTRHRGGTDKEGGNQSLSYMAATRSHWAVQPPSQLRAAAIQRRVWRQR